MCIKNEYRYLEDIQKTKTIKINNKKTQIGDF